jgi:hypothetical protein
MAIPKKNTAQAQDPGWFPISRSEESVREVVVTFTVKLDAVAEATETVEGTLQTAPTGAPVQASDAVPLIPPPPMASV